MDSVHEHNPSLWIATSAHDALPPLDGDARADVVVVGAGITGLTSSWLLTDAGLDVLLLEAGEVCSGVTGYTTAKVTALQSTIYSKLAKTWNDEVASTYAAANLAAVARMRKLVETLGIDCNWVGASAFTYSEGDEGVAEIEAEIEAATRAGLAATFTTDTDLPYRVAGAARLDHQAQFHPRRYCLGLVDAIRGRGGRVVEHTRARYVDVDERRVVTDRGVVQADAVVLATHLPFPKAGGYFARAKPMRSYAVAIEPGPEARLPEGMYISVDEPMRSIRSAADRWIIVGGEGHKVGQDPDTTRRYQALESWSGERFAPARVGHRWSAQDYVSADHLPFIGRLSPGSERVYVGTGYGKWGMTNGTVAAIILADLIQGRDNEWAATFDSTRFALRQSAVGLVRENIDVAKRFAGDRLATRNAPDVTELQPGQGDIAEIDGTRVAAFRDDDGHLHAVSPICTHFGCQVTFNPAERSWDCPCHGSRFDIDGQVLQGPAVEDLAARGD